MRFLAALATVAVVAVRGDIGEFEAPSRQTDHSLLDYSPEIEVVDFNKAYVVKLDCVGCPFAAKIADNKAEWQQPPRENALVLNFKIDTTYYDKPTLLLNGRGISPLEPMTPFINALQVPANITVDEMKELGYGSRPYGVQLPLQYEHTVLRTQEHGELTIQFDITALPLDEMSDPRFYPSFVGEPYIMGSEQQKLVQLRLHRSKDTGELLIEDVSVIARADRTQPYRMKCGRLAMVQTTYDPRQWDVYGKYGTWERAQNLVIGEAGYYWSEYARNIIMFPLAMLGLYCMALTRRWYKRRQERKAAMGDDAEVALLSSGYDDVPPAYADIPVIKIEEYD